MQFDRLKRLKCEGNLERVAEAICGGGGVNCFTLGSKKGESHCLV